MIKVLHKYDNNGWYRYHWGTSKINMVSDICSNFKDCANKTQLKKHTLLFSCCDMIYQGNGVSNFYTVIDLEEPIRLSIDLSMDTNRHRLNYNGVKYGTMEEIVGALNSILINNQG